MPCREVPEDHRQLKRTEDELLEMPKKKKDFSDKQMEVRLPDSLATWLGNLPVVHATIVCPGQIMNPAIPAAWQLDGVCEAGLLSQHAEPSMLSCRSLVRSPDRATAACASTSRSHATRATAAISASASREFDCPSFLLFGYTWHRTCMHMVTCIHMCCMLPEATLERVLIITAYDSSRPFAQLYTAVMSRQVHIEANVVGAAAPTACGQRTRTE